MIPLFVTIFMINHVKGMSHSGTEFVLGFPEFSSWIPSTDKTDLVMCTAHTSDVNVTIFFHKDAQYYPIMSVLSPSTTKIVTIPLGVRVEGSGLSRKGIFILATNPITVMGLSSGSYSAASFLALPIDALGVDYYVVTWERDMSAIEFLIIGVYNNTDVQLTFTTYVSLTGYFAERGYPFTETINRFDTLQIQAMEDLSGTRIEANKKIAVISGNAKAVVSPTPRNSWDHAIEMLPSVDKWGKHFIVTSSPLSNRPDYIKLVSGFQNTYISMNCGSFKSFILAKSGAIRKEALYSDSSCEIFSNKPILVVLFTNNQINNSDKSDPAMVLISPVEQWRNAYTFSVAANDTIFDNYLILILRDVDRSEILLNGYAVDTQSFKRIQNTNFYSGFQSILKGVYTLTLESGNATFSALLYGKGHYIAYYVPVGMNQNSLYQMSTTTPTPPIITTPLTHLKNEFTAEMQTTEIPTARPGSTETSEKLTFEAETNNPSVSSGDSTYSGHLTEETVHVDINESSTSFSTTDKTDSLLDNSTCGCCLNYSISNEDLEAKLRELRLKLLVPKKSTALYKRSLISVMDNRPSAIITGSTLGVLVLVVLASVIILMDIIKFCCKK